jgi:hypothetical protein
MTEEIEPIESNMPVTPVQEFTSLAYVDGFKLPEPASFAHRVMLWQAAGHLAMPFKQSELVNNTAGAIRRQHLPPHSSHHDARSEAKSVLRDFLQDGIFVLDAPHAPIGSIKGSRDFDGITSPRSAVMHISGLGLYVAAESARRTLLTANRSRQIETATVLRHKVVRFLLLNTPIEMTTHSSAWRQTR